MIHDFRVLLTAGSEELEADVVVDFHALKQRADAILAEIAYSVLDENAYIDTYGDMRQYERDSHIKEHFEALSISLRDEAKYVIERESGK